MTTTTAATPAPAAQLSPREMFERIPGTAIAARCLVCELLGMVHQCGKFEMTRQISHTDQGTVFACLDTSSKLFVEKVVQLKEGTSRRVELSHLQSCRHPCIVRVLETHHYSERFLVFRMAYFAGNDLGQMIRSRASPTPESVVLRLVARMTLAVHYLHEMRSVLHRDIKPCNFFLHDDNERVVLGDFGLARDDVSVGTEQALTFCGSMRNCAPELFRGVNVNLGFEKPQIVRYGYKADIWSLGATVYELLCGEPPIPVKHPDGLAYTPEEFVKHAASGRYTPMVDRNTGYRRELSVLCDWMLNVSPKGRPAARTILTSALLHPYAVEALHAMAAADDGRNADVCKRQLLSLTTKREFDYVKRCHRKRNSADDLVPVVVTIHAGMVVIKEDKPDGKVLSRNLAECTASFDKYVDPLSLEIHYGVVVKPHGKPGVFLVFPRNEVARDDLMRHLTDGGASFAEIPEEDDM